MNSEQRTLADSVLDTLSDIDAAMAALVLSEQFHEVTKSLGYFIDDIIGREVCCPRHMAALLREVIPAVVSDVGERAAIAIVCDLSTSTISRYAIDSDVVDISVTDDEFLFSARTSTVPLDPADVEQYESIDVLVDAFVVDASTGDVYSSGERSHMDSHGVDDLQQPIPLLESDTCGGFAFDCTSG